MALVSSLRCKDVCKGRCGVPWRLFYLLGFEAALKVGSSKNKPSSILRITERKLYLKLTDP